MPLDSTNWSQTETETKPDVFSLEGLIAWLETQPKDGRYRWADCNGGCLIGLYGRHIGLTMREMCTPRKNGIIPYRVLTPTGLAVCPPHTFGAALSRARALIASRPKE